MDATTTNTASTSVATKKKPNGDGNRGRDIPKKVTRKTTAAVNDNATTSATVAAVDVPRTTRMKTRFYALWNETLAKKKDNNVTMDRRRYAEVMEQVKQARNATTHKTSLYYRRLSRYDIVTLGGVEKLIARVKEGGRTLRAFVCSEELFDTLDETHRQTGHGGRERMKKAADEKYANVTTGAIATYLRLCETCQKKQKLLTRGMVVKPILHSEMNSRCQMDLIDMQTNPDGDLKYIMLYQDHLTKFVLLRALANKTADAVARELLDIFSVFGAPNILHSDNGREFCNETIARLCEMWGEVKLVHGKPRHSQSQGSIERANQDVENMLSTWMETNATAKWSEGLRFVQAMKNRVYHQGIRCSPYEAMFGAPMKMGLTSMAALRGVLKDLATEEDLARALNIDDDDDETGSDDDEEPTPGNDDDGPLEPTSDDVMVAEEDDDDDEYDDVDDDDDDEGKVESSAKKRRIRRTTAAAVDTTAAATTSKENEAVLTRRRKRSKCRLWKYGRVHRVAEARKNARAALVLQAQRMKDSSNKRFARPQVGQNVAVRIPNVDRAKMDPKSAIAVVIAVKDNEFYELGTKKGKLNALYTANQLTVCKDTFLTVDEVPDAVVSLRKAVKSLSLVGGQGFKKCNCLQKCTSNRCKCKAWKMMCNSRCHNSQPCQNK